MVCQFLGQPVVKFLQFFGATLYVFGMQRSRSYFRPHWSISKSLVKVNFVFSFSALETSTKIVGPRCQKLINLKRFYVSNCDRHLQFYKYGLGPYSTYFL